MLKFLVVFKIVEIVTSMETEISEFFIPIQDATWHPDQDVNHNYDFLLTLTDKVKFKNFSAARRAIGSFLAEIYKRVVTTTECPTDAQQKYIMAGAETLYSQLRGVVGNGNFAMLFGLKTLSKPAINLDDHSHAFNDKLTMSRIGLKLSLDKPTVLYSSASANKIKFAHLGVSNHADINTDILFHDVMRDIQADTNIFISKLN
jgi:hypothetical protein